MVTLQVVLTVQNKLIFYSYIFWRFGHYVQKCRKIRVLGCVSQACTRARVAQPSPHIFLHICSLSFKRHMGLRSEAECLSICYLSSCRRPSQFKSSSLCVPESIRETAASISFSFNLLPFSNWEWKLMVVRSNEK